MACINPNDPIFKEILARVGNPILAEIEFDQMTEPEEYNEISLYLSRQINDKFGVKIGPLVPDMLDLINSQPVINQEDIDNKKLEC